MYYVRPFFKQFFDQFFKDFKWVLEANMAPKIDKNLKNQEDNKFWKIGISLGAFVKNKDSSLPKSIKIDKKSIKNPISFEA